MRARVALAVALAVTLSACSSCKDGGGAATEGGAGDGGGKAGSSEAGPSASTARTPEEERLWDEAKDGDEDALRRLANHEGARGLAERGADGAHEKTALRAMAYADGFAQLPMLGAAAATAPEDEATIAAESAAELAARKRGQVDPEDREELADGCGALLGAAKDSSRPKVVRVNAIRALRMLAEQGCVDPAAIPKDLDAK